MDWDFIIAAAIPLGLTTTALWVTYRVSRKRRHANRRVGYQREEIQIDPADVPEFKPTWRDARH